MNVQYEPIAVIVMLHVPILMVVLVVLVKQDMKGVVRRVLILMNVYYELICVMIMECAPIQHEDTTVVVQRDFIIR